MKYKIIVDKQSRTNPSNERREYEIDIKELHCKGDIYDTLVITKDEDYVMRRLSLSEYQVLTVLPEPVKEPLQNINIELFEGDNYIYLVDMVGNRFYAEYLIKNDFTDTYVTVNQMNSAINQTAGQIELSVNQRLEEYATSEELEGAVTDLNSTITQTAKEINLEVSKKVNDKDLTGANITLRINDDTSEAKINADKIELSANDILNLLSGNSINLGSKNITINSDNFNVDKNGKVTIKDNGQDSSLIVEFKGNEVNYSATIQSTGAKFIGHEGEFSGCVSIDAGFATAGGNIRLAPSEDGNETDYTIIQNGTVDALKISQRSLESQKKNIEKYKNNAIGIIKDSQIYTYNFKSEEDNCQKHIGFVIGDNGGKYKTPKELILKNGIDLYSTVSVLWKAVQEQQEIIEKLEKRVQQLEVQNGQD